MRRVASMMVVLSCAVAGASVAGAMAAQSGAGPAGGHGTQAGGGAPAGSPAAGRRTGWVAGIGTAKLVRFAGYTIDVPAGWPVYGLAGDPTRCVRYDQHAVYLGRPGADQQCPAHLAGRVATLTLERAGQAGSVPGGDWRPVRGWQPADGSPLAGGYQARRSRAAATLSQDTWNRQLLAVFGHRGLAITATYGASAGLVLRILATVRRAGPARPARSAATAAIGATAPGAAVPAAAAVRARPATQRAPNHHGCRRNCHRCQHNCHKCHHNCHRCHRNCHRCHRHCLRLPVKGFDTCTAPSLHAMWAWRHSFRAAAIYLGGPEAACGWGNLSAAWVRATTRMGWALVPAYVGPQAPCTGFAVRVQPGHAEPQGRAAARQAMGLARDLGLHRHAPIYYDMEAYHTRRAQCRNAVLSFLNGWCRELRSHGYTCGVYSSASAAAEDLGRAARVYGRRIAKPNSLWFGLWDGFRNVQGGPYLRDSWWAGHRRIKQYKGPRWLRIHGVKLNIDRDLVNGATYR
jgi:glycoside hydrolase-like protein